MDYQNLEKYFPFENIRDVQQSVIPVLKEKLLDSKTKVIFCELGCGIGKSALAVMSAKAADKAYLLTANKALQQQYVKDFSKDLVELKGRSSYDCHNHKKQDGTKFNCSDSPCQRSPSGLKTCAANATCGYHHQLHKAGKSPITLFNFASGYAQMKYNAVKEDGKGIFDKRNIMIIDEAHLIPEYLTSMASISLSKEAFNDLFDWSGDWNNVGSISNGKPEGWIDTLQDQGSFENWIDMFQRLKSQCEVMQDNAFYSNKDKFDSFVNKINDFLELVQDLETEYGESFKASDLFVQEYGVNGVNFQPVNVKTLFQFLMTKADKIVLMSATFLNVGLYAKMLGLSSEETFHIYRPSPFEKKNRMIRVSETVGKLSAYKNLENKEKMITAINSIMYHFEDSKGIIHSPSYSWSEYIFERVSGINRERILFPKNSSEKDAMMKEHIESLRPTVLLSPSMREGVDLKGDLSRFQIISKVPWPNIKDPLIEKRGKVYYKYANLLTLLSLIQSCGRSVRNETDFCSTFMLDANIWYLLNNNKEMIPTDFLDTVVRG